MASRPFAVIYFLLSCFSTHGAPPSVCNSGRGVEHSCHQDEDLQRPIESKTGMLADEVQLLQTRAVVENGSMDFEAVDRDSLGVSPRVSSDPGNEMNEMCGLFGCDEPPSEFKIPTEGLKYLEINLDEYDHNLAGLPDDDESLEFVTSEEAMRDFGKSYSNYVAEEFAIFNQELAVVQKEYQEEYRKLHPNETSALDWNWDWEMKDDPAEFVDGDAPDWEDKIRLVRPGLDDSDYKFGKALYTIFSTLSEHLAEEDADEVPIETALSNWRDFHKKDGTWSLEKEEDTKKVIANNATSLALFKSKWGWNPFRSIANAARNAHNAVKNTFNNAVNKVKKTVSGLTSFVDLGKNIVKIVKQLQSLINCMNGLPEKYKLFGMVKWAVGVARKPGGLLANFIPDAWSTYMKPVIQASTTFIRNELARGNQKYSKKLSISDQVFAKIDDFAKIPGMELLGCIERHLIRPAFKAVGHVIDLYVNLIVNPVKKVFNQFILAPNGFIAKFTSKIGELVTTIMPVSEQIGQVAKSKASEFCLEELTRVKAGKPPRTQLQKILTVGAATLSEYLVQFFNDGVNTLLRPILEKALEFVGQLLQTGLHALDGLCGLIPEAGAAICALITNTISAGMGMAGRGLMTGGISLMKTLGADIIKQSASFLVTQTNKEMTKNVQIPSILVPFVPIIQGFVKIMNQHINKYLGECDVITSM